MTVITQRIKPECHDLEVGLPASAACPGTTALSTTKEAVLTNLAHRLTPELLNEVMKKLKRKAAAGIDGVTYKEFSQLASNELHKLAHRLRSRSYKCKPNRRVFIPKGYNDYRALGIPCMDDKVSQGAVKYLLEPIYEGIFHPHSYAYRPRRSCLQAVTALKDHLEAIGGGFVIEADLQKFFDSVPHEQLMDFIRLRVKDPIILHAIWSFLSAGTLVARKTGRGMDLVWDSQGTPQGGVISPLLANIYLHYVLDEHLVQEISPSIPGGVEFFRYADDFICVAKTEDAALSVLDLIKVRLSTFGLQLNVKKTFVLNLRRPISSGQHPAAEVRSKLRFLGFDINWRQAPGGVWGIGCSPREGRTLRALGLAQTALRDRWTKTGNRKAVQKYCSEIQAGYTNYYSLPGCESEIKDYKDQMINLLNTII